MSSVTPWNPPPRVALPRSFPPSMTRTLFTLGYQKGDLEEFIDLLRAECLALYRSFLAQHEMLVDQFDTLIGQLHAHGKRVCLTCFERHPDDCHRSILADSWRQRGRRSVEHLATDGAPRLLAV